MMKSINSSEIIMKIARAAISNQKRATYNIFKTHKLVISYSKNNFLTLTRKVMNILRKIENFLVPQELLKKIYNLNFSFKVKI